jgi:hypothetical protein
VENHPPAYRNYYLWLHYIRDSRKSNKNRMKNEGSK